MAGLLYFVPRLKALGQACANALGMSNGLGDSFAAVETTAGPFGEGGIYVWATPPGVPPDDLPNTEHGDLVWERGDQYAVGYHQDRPPLPSDLIKPTAVGIYQIRLLDGNDWIIPTARSIDGGSELPRAVYVEGGKVVKGDVLPAYARLFELGERAWDAFRSDDGSIDEADALAICSEVLSFNYRLCPLGVLLLGKAGRLFSTENYRLVLGALYDYPAWLAAEAERIVSAEGKVRAATACG